MAVIESTTMPGSALPPLPQVRMAPQTEEQTIEDTDDEREEGEDDRKIVPEPEYDSSKARLVAWIADHNIARHLDFDTLQKIGQEVYRGYEMDENSRAEWKQDTEAALRFATQEAQPKQYPWPKACLSLDTDILTENGWKPIADVVPGERVYSRAPDGAADFFPVSRTFRHVAEEVVHFHGKSIDLLATPNHNMLVEDRDTGATSFIQAGEFVRRHAKGPNQFCLSRKSIPLTSAWRGDNPTKVYGIDGAAYARFLGWYVSEGFCDRPTGSFGIAQSRRANPRKYEILRHDIEACGFTYQAREDGFTVHARSMPDLFKAELRALGTAYSKHLPRHVLSYAPELLEQVLDTLVAGDGRVRQRAHQRQRNRTYFTTSSLLAGQVQEICQKLGMRGSVTTVEARAGGVINGRAIIGAAEGYSISIATKATIQVLKLARELQSFNDEVACVEVYPHNTIYVRRKGKAVWVGNSNIIYPLITAASLQFAAKAYPAIVPNRNVVKGIVWGTDDGMPATQTGKMGGAPLLDPQSGQPQWLIPPGSKRKHADRVGAHMSWQLLVEMPEWEPQTDQMLHQLPIVGGAVRKTFRDYAEKRNCSVLVPLMNIVWDMNAESFEVAPRHTEILTLYPHEITTNERADETFLTLNYGPSDDDGADPNDDQAPHVFLEQHTRYDLDGDGYAEPLTVTIHKRSQRVVRITARFEEPGIKETDYQDDEDEEIQSIQALGHYTLYSFLPNPKGGSYPVGFGHLLKPMNEAINTSINQMFDAGHLQIAGGGFIGTSLSIPSGPTTFQLGEYIPVNNKGQSIRDAVFPIPFPGPSEVLFQLLGFLVSAAERTAAVQDVLTGDSSSLANTAPTTMLALIEQGMKVYTAIYKRIYRALKEELAKLYRLNRLNMEDDQRFQMGDDWQEISPEDYRLGGGVEPMADPTMVTDMQRLGRAGVLLQFKDDPLFQPLEIRRRYLEACGIEQIDKLLLEKMPPPVAMQADLALKQAELGRVRAAEIKDQTQGILNMALARAKANGPEIEWFEKQIDIMRLHIEALNTTVKAADVDAKFHGHNVHMQAAQQKAREVANNEPTPTPPPESAGPINNGQGIPAVAPPPGNGNGSALPPGPGDELAGGSGGALGG
jgi:chaperonin GroES